jgi:hypothetical protein
MADIIIKYGTTDIPGAIVKGNFSYFSASTLDLGPTSVTGLYSGIDAPEGGYTIYTGPGSPFAINLALNDTELNTYLINIGAPNVNVNDNITWASSNDNIYINSGGTLSLYYIGGNFTSTNVIPLPYVTLLNSGGTQDTSFNIGNGFNLKAGSVAIQSD